MGKEGGTSFAVRGGGFSASRGAGFSRASFSSGRFSGETTGFSPRISLSPNRSPSFRISSVSSRRGHTESRSGRFTPIGLSRQSHAERGVLAISKISVGSPMHKKEISMPTHPAAFGRKRDLGFERRTPVTEIRPRNIADIPATKNRHSESISKKFTPLETRINASRQVDRLRNHRRQPRKPYHSELAPVVVSKTIHSPETEKKVSDKMPERIVAGKIDKGSGYERFVAKASKKNKKEKEVEDQMTNQPTVQPATALDIKRLEMLVDAKREQVRKFELPLLPRDKTSIPSRDLMLNVFNEKKTELKSNQVLLAALEAQTENKTKTSTKVKTYFRRFLAPERAVKSSEQTQTQPEAKAKVGVLEQTKTRQQQEQIIFQRIRNAAVEKKKVDEYPKLAVEEDVDSKRSEFITKAVKFLLKYSDRKATGKDLVQNLPENPSSDMLSALAKMFGRKWDGSWTKIREALSKAEELGTEISKKVTKTIREFPAVVLRRRPRRHATKRNAKVVLGEFMADSMPGEKEVTDFKMAA